MDEEQTKHQEETSIKFVEEATANTKIETVTKRRMNILKINEQKTK